MRLDAVQNHACILRSAIGIAAGGIAAATAGGVVAGQGAAGAGVAAGGATPAISGIGGRRVRRALLPDQGLSASD